jgi:hypothetical protein
MTKFLRTISAVAALLLIYTVIACGGYDSSASHSTEEGTTPLLSGKYLTYQGTYKLCDIYSNDLSIVKAEGIQVVDLQNRTVKIVLFIETLLGKYRVEREFALSDSGSGSPLKCSTETEQIFESENSSIRNEYFLDTEYNALLSSFRAHLSLEWQKVSDKTGL